MTAPTSPPPPSPAPASSSTPAPGAAAPGTSAPATSSTVPSFELPDASVRRTGRPTPMVLRTLAVACIVTAVVAGLFIALISYQRAERLDDAAAKARQVVVLTDARSQVAAADAAATAAFLVGGVEDAEGRDAYLSALAAATSDLNTAAASAIGDSEAIAGIAEGAGSYRGTVEYARALNRQNLPLGSAYLRSAGEALATDVVEPLDAEIASVRGSIQTNAPWPTVALTVLAVLAFAACFAWATTVLARHTRRRFNVGVVAGAVLVGLVVLGAVMSAAEIKTTVDDAVDGPLRSTTQIAQARADVFDARSALNLALIARGSGQAYLVRVDDDLDDAQARIDSLDGTGVGGPYFPTTLAFDRVTLQIQNAIDADAAGQYDEAVAIATDRTREEGVVPAFEAFEEVSASELATQADAAEDKLTQGRPWLLALTVGAVVAGVVGAALAWSGIGQRRKEYM